MTTTLTPAANQGTRSAANAPAPYLVRDPICGMEFNPVGAAATRTQDGETVYFCSERCAREFDHRRDWQAGHGAPEDVPLELGAHAHATPLGAAPYAAGSTVPRWLVPVGLAAVAAVLAVTVFGVSLSNLLVFALVLACPLMMMLGGHGGHGGHAGHDERSAASGRRDTKATGETKPSCH